MDFFAIQNKSNVDIAAHLPNKDLIKKAECAIGVKFGGQLKRYLLEYGYIGYKSIEFYGMNSKQGLSSDLVKQTLYLHKYYADTKNYVAIENCGEGDYAMVDSFDNVYIFQEEENQLKAANKTLFKYIAFRLASELQ